MWWFVIYIISLLASFTSAWFVVKEDLIREQGIPALFVVSLIPVVNIVVTIAGILMIYDASLFIENLGYKIAKYIRGEVK